MKALLVEDDFTSRLALQRQLEKLGDVHIAVDGKEAVEAFEAMLRDGAPYDVVFLDIMMPVMDGHEALQKMRAAEVAAGIHVGQGCKVIMTTALSDSANVMQAFRNEADGYVVKPIVPEKLVEEMRKLGLVS